MANESTMTAKNESSFLLKGDISGIQEFIFSVSSKKAAKTLKARSEYVEKIADDALNIIAKLIYPNSDEKIAMKSLIDKELIYNGGGNFFLTTNYAHIDNLIWNVEVQINTQVAHYGLYLTLSKTKYIENDFTKSWANINRQSSIDKMRKFSNNYSGFENRIDTNFSFESKKHLSLWSKELISENQSFVDENQEDEKIIHGAIISLLAMAEFARQRTGIAKIGILKMDADNMSSLFNDVSTIEEAKEKSNIVDNFFNPKNNHNKEYNVFGILENKYPTKTEDKQKKLTNKVINNIYPVFSGGDDCFFIGAFDVVAWFAREIQKQFSAYMKKQNLNITLSASLQFVEPHYPVVRFAENAEDDLHRAKKRKNENKEEVKNGICFLGEVLSWQEFELVYKLKDELVELVSEQNARSLLQKIQESAVEFNILQNNALEGKMDLPKVWKLYYYLRNVKDADLREKIEKNIISKYEKSLLAAFTDKIATNPVVFPLAARWAELITRK